MVASRLLSMPTIMELNSGSATEMTIVTVPPASFLTVIPVTSGPPLASPAGSEYV